MVEDNDSLTWAKLLDVRANRHYNSGCFVTENTRGRVGAGRNFLQIRPADAATVHPQQQLPWADLRHGHSFQPHVLLAAIDRSQHGFGNLAPRCAYLNRLSN
jgi:hypothetical protein